MRAWLFSLPFVFATVLAIVALVLRNGNRLMYNMCLAYQRGSTSCSLLSTALLMSFIQQSSGINTNLYYNDLWNDRDVIPQGDPLPPSVIAIYVVNFLASCVPPLFWILCWNPALSATSRRLDEANSTDDDDVSVCSPLVTFLRGVQRRWYVSWFFSLRKLFLFGALATYGASLSAGVIGLLGDASRTSHVAIAIFFVIGFEVGMGSTFYVLAFRLFYRPLPWSVMQRTLSETARRRQRKLRMAASRRPGSDGTWGGDRDDDISSHGSGFPTGGTKPRPWRGGGGRAAIAEGESNGSANFGFVADENDESAVTTNTPEKTVRSTGEPASSSRTHMTATSSAGVMYGTMAEAAPESLLPSTHAASRNAEVGATQQKNFSAPGVLTAVDSTSAHADDGLDPLVVTLASTSSASAVPGGDHSHHQRRGAINGTTVLLSTPSMSLAAAAMPTGMFAAKATHDANSGGGMNHKGGEPMRKQPQHLNTPTRHDSPQRSATHQPGQLRRKKAAARDRDAVRSHTTDDFGTDDDMDDGGKPTQQRSGACSSNASTALIADRRSSGGGRLDDRDAPGGAVGTSRVVMMNSFASTADVDLFVDESYYRKSVPFHVSATNAAQIITNLLLSWCYPIVTSLLTQAASPANKGAKGDHSLGATYYPVIIFGGGGVVLSLWLGMMFFGYVTCCGCFAWCGLRVCGCCRDQPVHGRASARRHTNSSASHRNGEANR